MQKGVPHGNILSPVSFYLSAVDRPSVLHTFLLSLTFNQRIVKAVPSDILMVMGHGIEDNCYVTY